VVLSILLAIVVACLGFVAWVFQHYRPTIYVADRYIDLNQRHIAAAAGAGVVTGLFALGLLVRRLFLN
jgi:hypothetical protein